MASLPWNRPRWRASAPAFVALCLCSCSGEVVEKLAAESGMTPLLQSRFVAGTEGWSVEGSGFHPSKVLHKTLSVEGAPGGAWHWRAPKAFHGNWSHGYGGMIEVMRGYFEFNTAGKRELVHTAGFDITLESHLHGLSIGVPSLVTLGSFEMRHAVGLSPSGGWVLSSTGRPASEGDIKKVLGAVSGLTLRGGHYHGGEHAFLSQVLLHGPPPAPDAAGALPAAPPAGGADAAASVAAAAAGEETGLQRALRERERTMAGGAAHVVVSGKQPPASGSAPVGLQHAAHPQQQKQHATASGVGATQPPLEPKHAGVLRCADDGAGLPVARLMEAARLQGEELLACLASGEGAFGVSRASLSYHPATAPGRGGVGGSARVPLSAVGSVSVDEGGVVVVVGQGGGGEVLLRGCSMAAFDLGALGEFFEVVQEATRRA